MLIADGQCLPLRLHDVCAVPAWRFHHIEASENELILLRMTDRPTHHSLGLYRKQHT
jgi:gentisate 1,2-dioxygenase